MAPKKSSSLLEVASFIRALHSEMHTGLPSTLAGLWFSRKSDGTLHLNGAEADAYRAIVDRLDKEFNNDQDLSRRTIERLLQDAMFHALDIAGDKGEAFPDRVSRAIGVLEVKLSAPAARFRCFMPVEGFALADLPATFGGLRFVKFGESQKRQLGGSRGKKGGSNRWRLAQTVKEGKLWHQGCAVVSIWARDSESARVRARLTTQATLDAINFLADLVPYNHGWLRQPGGVAPGLECSAIVSEKGLSLPHELIGPLGPFALQKLRGSQWSRTFRLLSALSLRAKAGTMGEVLLAAFRWAGRASVEARREQSFLLFAIALETAGLPERQNQELNYRLALRVTRLLGKSAADRKEIHRSVVRLYGVRSKIVHSGNYEVTDADLGLLRALTKRVLLRFLRRRTEWSKKSSDVGIWLDGLVMR